MALRIRKKSTGQIFGYNYAMAMSSDDLEVIQCDVKKKNGGIVYGKAQIVPKSRLPQSKKDVKAFDIVDVGRPKRKPSKKETVTVEDDTGIEDGDDDDMFDEDKGEAEDPNPEVAALAKGKQPAKILQTKKPGA